MTEKIGTNEVYQYLLENILEEVQNQKYQVVVIIDEKTEKIKETCETINPQPYIIELKTFRRENANSVVAHLFDTFPIDLSKYNKIQPYKGISKTKEFQQKFWHELKEYMENNKTFLKLRKPYPQHWYSIAVGRSNFEIALTINSVKKRLGCEICITGKNSKKAFTLLKKDKDEIESELGEKLEWQELLGRKYSRIVLFTEGDIYKTEQWEEYFQWFQKHAEKFHKIFSERIKNLNL